jgi:hypothetical protein
MSLLSDFHLRNLKLSIEVAKKEDIKVVLNEEEFWVNEVGD